MSCDAIVPRSSCRLTVPAAGAQMGRVMPEQRKSLTDQARRGRKVGARARDAMVITSHPVATHDAVEVMREGGTACDAALTAAATQIVVEPHMTTVTGSLSLLYHEAASGRTTYMNGTVGGPREPLVGLRAQDLASGRGVGVPGWWAGFEAASGRWGALGRARLLAPA